MMDPRDPDCKLYVICTWISVAVLLGTCFVSLGYLIVFAPSEVHTLDEGRSPVGWQYPLICGIIFTACLAALVIDIRKRLARNPACRNSALMRAPLSKAGILFCLISLFSLIMIVFSDLIGESIDTDVVREQDPFGTEVLFAVDHRHGRDEIAHLGEV